MKRLFFLFTTFVTVFLILFVLIKIENNLSKEKYVVSVKNDHLSRILIGYFSDKEYKIIKEKERIDFYPLISNESMFQKDLAYFQENFQRVIKGMRYFYKIGLSEDKSISLEIKGKILNCSDSIKCLINHLFLSTKSSSLRSELSKLQLDAAELNLDKDNFTKVSYIDASDLSYSKEILSLPHLFARKIILAALLSLMISTLLFVLAPFRKIK